MAPVAGTCGADSAKVAVPPVWPVSVLASAMPLLRAAVLGPFTPPANPPPPFIRNRPLHAAGRSIAKPSPCGLPEGEATTPTTRQYSGTEAVAATSVAAVYLMTNTPSAFSADKVQPGMAACAAFTASAPATTSAERSTALKGRRSMLSPELDFVFRAIRTRDSSDGRGPPPVAAAMLAFFLLQRCPAAASRRRAAAAERPAIAPRPAAASRPLPERYPHTAEPETPHAAPPAARRFGNTAPSPPARRTRACSSTRRPPWVWNSAPVTFTPWKGAASGGLP